jgi:hypothetical protein
VSDESLSANLTSFAKLVMCRFFSHHYVISFSFVVTIFLRDFSYLSLSAT